MKLILSTLTSPQDVTFTRKRPNGSLEVVKKIHINGGANVADRKTLITPQGVITELTDADYDLLVSCEWYKRQEKAGFIRPVESVSDADKPEKKGMKKRDKSAQKTEKDYGEKGVKVHTGKPSDDVD